MEYFKQFRQTYMVNFWRPTPAVIALGVFCSLLFWYNWNLLGSYRRIYKMGRTHILQFFGVDISNWGYYKIMKMEGTS